MTRGNQRERDRKKNEKAQKSVRTANTLTGTEFARKKEDDAAKMRAKQAAGKLSSDACRGVSLFSPSLALQRITQAICCFYVYSLCCCAPNRARLGPC
ncbi:hypothetical protein BDW68DRAFT_125900 [Aspergillus falconensis]